VIVTTGGGGGLTAVTVKVRDEVVVPLALVAVTARVYWPPSLMESEPEPVAVEVPTPLAVKLTALPFNVAVSVLIAPDVLVPVNPMGTLSAGPPIV